MDDNERTFSNRAEVRGAERIHCDNCFEQVIFMLRDKDHEFSMGLTAMIECIAFAIRNGDLPKLPRSWCADVEKTLNIAFEDNISYYDYDIKKTIEKLDDFPENG